MSEPLDLSVVVPAYNEAERIGPSLDRLIDWLDDERDLAAEIIVVDDGSTDGTRALVENRASSDERVRVVGERPNRGKGAAVGKGMEHAQGEFVLFTDADLSMPIEGYHDLRAALERGADVAIASRNVAGSTVGEPPPPYRAAMGRVFNAVVRASVLPGIRDTQCGFKMFRRSAARAIFPRRTLDNFAFDVEILWLARQLGLRIVEVPTHWDHRGNSRILPWTDSVRMFYSVLSIPWRHRSDTVR